VKRGNSAEYISIEPRVMPAHQSCSLDVADSGGETLAAVGELLGVSRERIRQLEEIALRKTLREAKRLRILPADVFGGHRAISMAEQMDAGPSTHDESRTLSRYESLPRDENGWRTQTSKRKGDWR
jgi:hypothetical protein